MYEEINVDPDFWTNGGRPSFPTTLQHLLDLHKGLQAIHRFTHPEDGDSNESRSVREPLFYCL